MKLTRSFLIGVFAGLRSQTAPCAAAWALAGRSDHLPWPFSLIGRRFVRQGLTFGAGLELIGDKLPITPSRTEPAGVFARVLAGGGTGACVAPEGLLLPGLVAGVSGALLGTFGGHRLRVSLPAMLNLPDFSVALAEDAVAIGGSLLVMLSLPQDVTEERVTE